MRREDVAELLHKAVGKVRFKQRHFLQHRVGSPLHGEEERHFVGAELVDHQEGVFAILLGDIVNIAVHIFPGHRQMLELGEDMAADLGQYLRLVGANVKHLWRFSAGKVSRRTAKTASLPAQPEDSNRRSGSAL